MSTAIYFPSPVNRLCIRTLAAGAALWVAGSALRGAPLPFTIDNQDEQWKPATVQQSVAPGITFETLVTHIGRGDRLIVLSSPATSDPAESLSVFAHHLIDSFTSYRSANVTETAATEIGYSGRELHLDLATDKEAFDCTMFVFAEGKNRWGVVYARPEDAPAPAVPVFSLLHKAIALPADVTSMAPFRIKDVPLSAFPLSFRITRNTGTDRVLGIVVTEVPERSPTERAGVKVGDAIIAINGRASAEFSIGVGKESELGRIFLNRKPGDAVELELMHAGADKPFSVTLHVPNPPTHGGWGLP